MASENSDTLEGVTFFGTFLHDAAIYGNYEIAKYRVGSGIDVNKKAGYRNGTALAPADSARPHNQPHYHLIIKFINNCIRK
jgi:hypothetical protein